MLKKVSFFEIFFSSLIHIGQFLNGVAGPIGSGAMPTLSSIWFPADERITATAIASSISALGSALPFILGKERCCL